jgi:rubrerythrin
MSEFTGKTVKPIASTEELLAYSLALETEAVERFNELADQMEMHYNFEVADLFRKLANIEGIHIDNVNKASACRELPPMSAWEFDWQDGQSPEGGSAEDAHYLMQAWQAIELAMQGEKRAVAFFQHVAATATDEDVVNMALELVEEEEEHVYLLEQWQKRFPKPEEGWDEDLDPPNISE